MLPTQFGKEPTKRTPKEIFQKIYLNVKIV